MNPLMLQKRPELAEHQADKVFQYSLSRYMWQTLHSQSCKEKLPLTGKEGGSETRL